MVGFFSHTFVHYLMEVQTRKKRKQKSGNEKEKKRLSDFINKKTKQLTKKNAILQKKK